MIKIIGITISVLSLVIALFGVFALVNANEMAQILSLAINEFENAEWQAHWQTSSIVLLASGCIGLFAGIGIMKNRQWAFFLFTLLLTLFILGQALMTVSGYARFEFEKINPIEISGIMLICIFSWFLYIRRKKAMNT